MRILFIILVLLTAVGVYSGYEIVSEVTFAKVGLHPASREGMAIHR